MCNECSIVHHIYTCLQIYTITISLVAFQLAFFVLRNDSENLESVVQRAHAVNSGSTAETAFDRVALPINDTANTAVDKGHG
jgi:hypothetical protein